MSTLNLHQRLNQVEWELIADEVFGELDIADAATLERADPAARAAARSSLEHAAGALAAALAEEHGERLPSVVVERVSEQCARMSGGVDLARGQTVGMGVGSSVIARLLPWAIAAAACAAVAFMWPSDAKSPRAQLAILRASASDTREAAWSDWSLNGEPPKVAGVAGEVVWSDAEQKGVLHFRGLPRCPAGQRYQLWIVDAERGFDQRISGAVFDGGGDEVFVPVTPRIPVHKAQAFAVTIEEADGTWVSDMSRRVVIATVR